MKIALLGYGKMGKEIEKIALLHGHEVVLKISKSNLADLTATNLKKADVAIEFTTPETAIHNIYKCFDAGVPVVCGTTGWLKHWEEILKTCNEKGQAFFYASNYSIGVNLFFKLNEYLAQLMKPYKNYTPSLEETHHIHKKDAPSGTGITLAEGLIKKHSSFTNWALKENASKSDLPILSKREGEVPGTHSIKYTSACDEITITHEAYNRTGFAEGAVVAAAWLVGKKGVFNMTDLLGK
jgi:4-hydroxy-tetrahydrodipicolinate reductase